MGRYAIRAMPAIMLALVLTSCGGAAGPSKNIRVTSTDFEFSPNSFTVPADAEISVDFTNNGAVTHSFIIMKAGTEVRTHFTDADKANVYWEIPSVPAGETVKDTFTSPSAPGEYQIVCGVTGHFEAGMVAKLIVVAAQ